jgi:hypothetical protein
MFGRRARDEAGRFGVLVAMALACCNEQPPGDPRGDSLLDGSVAVRDDLNDSSQVALDAAGDAAMLAPPLDAGFDHAPDPDAGPAVQDGAAQTGREAVLLPDDWIPVSAAADTFADRPALVTCSAGAVVAELLSAERVLGIDTGDCDYVTAAQPTKRAIAIGETIKVRLWHFELSAPEPAEAHAALAIDDLEVLNERVAIPRPGGLIVKQVRVDRPVPIGSQALFHLHNHGANSWALVEVSAGP